MIPWGADVAKSRTFADAHQGDERRLERSLFSHSTSLSFFITAIGRAAEGESRAVAIFSRAHRQASSWH